MMQLGGKYHVQKNDLLFPELSFRINGICFDVFRQLGGNHSEKTYEKAVAIALSKAGIPFQEQLYVPIKYDGVLIGKYYLDFLINEVVVLELKRGKFVSFEIINQTKQYLSALNLQLALIACFTSNGVLIKRILHLNSVS